MTLLGDPINFSLRKLERGFRWVMIQFSEHNKGREKGLSRAVRVRETMAVGKRKNTGRVKKETKMEKNIYMMSPVNCRRPKSNRRR